MKSSTKLCKLHSLGLIAQVYTLTIIVIIMIFSQAIIDTEKFQYRPSLLCILYDLETLICIEVEHAQLSQASTWSGCSR